MHRLAANIFVVAGEHVSPGYVVEQVTPPRRTRIVAADREGNPHDPTSRSVAVAIRAVTDRVRHDRRWCPIHHRSRSGGRGAPAPDRRPGRAPGQRLSLIHI